MNDITHNYRPFNNRVKKSYKQIEKLIYIFSKFNILFIGFSYSNDTKLGMSYKLLEINEKLSDEDSLLFL